MCLTGCIPSTRTERRLRALLWCCCVQCSCDHRSSSTAWLLMRNMLIRRPRKMWGFIRKLLRFKVVRDYLQEYLRSGLLIPSESLSELKSRLEPFGGRFVSEIELRIFETFARWWRPIGNCAILRVNLAKSRECILIETDIFRGITIRVAVLISFKTFLLRYLKTFEKEDKICV